MRGQSGSVPAAESVARRIGGWSRRLAARALVNRAIDLHVIGLEHVPAEGPGILVARHYHHLYDAAAIMASVPREVHILVALDWLGAGGRLRILRWLAAAARWPGVWRAGGPRRNRDGYRLSLDLLRENRILLVFPEGYPTVDPEGTRKIGPAAFLPFDAGFLVLAERAGVDVPIVPVGVWYAPRPGGGWTMWLRFGSPTPDPWSGGRRARLATIEAEVRRLSAPPA